MKSAETKYLECDCGAVFSLTLLTADEDVLHCPFCKGTELTDCELKPLKPEQFN